MLPLTIMGAFAALAIAMFIGLMMLYASYASGLRDPSELADLTLDEGSRVLSADGQQLATFAAERREVVAFEDIPEILVNAQVAAEDQSFWSNPCIDFQGIVRAAYQNLVANDIVSGASTICQQLVRIRLIDADLMADPDRILERKIKEALLALKVSEAFPGQEGKERILEMYMNQVYYGNQAYGIAAAVEAYFGKDITSDRARDQVTLAEAAMVTALVRAPSRLDPTAEAVEREDENGRTILIVPDNAAVKLAQGFVLDNMVNSDYITREEADAALDERLVLARTRSAQYRAPHFVYAVRREARELLGNEEALDTAGLEITTTLEWEGYQRFAEKWAGVAYDMNRMSDQQLIRKYGAEAFKWIRSLQGRNINNDALVTLNYRTGAVLAYVGSANFYGEATDAHQPAYDVVGQAFRQSGSAFKPITYASGFESGAITPATMLMDIEGEIVDGYSVPDADQRQRGPVRVRDALKYSLNIPVAKAQQLIGTETVVEMAERLGLEWDPAQREVAVPSLTLGTIGVHQLDLAAAYGALANGGILAEPYMIQTIRDRNGEVIYDRAEDAPEPERVLSAESAYLVTDILADNTDPAQNVVWGERFQLTTDEGRRPATLKTGTTNDFRDLQAFGYLAPPEESGETEGAIITGVWVGNSDFSRIADVFAADGPTFIWHDYMEEVAAHNELPVRDFVRPDGIVELEVDQLSGMRPGEHTVGTITEIFARAHQPEEEDDLHRRLRIEAETGRIWQEGCGDFEAEPGTEDDEQPQPAERVYLDLGDYEDHHDTWDAANDRWIERWQGRESQIDRFPLRPLDAPLAPTDRCRPGQIPTSTPTPSPSPTPSPTPQPTATPEESLLPSVVPTPAESETPAPND